VPSLFGIATIRGRWKTTPPLVWPPMAICSIRSVPRASNSDVPPGGMEWRRSRTAAISSHGIATSTEAL
jgi:hypothetical protein